MKRYLLISFVCFCNSTFSQQVSWISKIEYSNWLSQYDIITNPNGNTCITGQLVGDALIGNNFISSNGNAAFYMASYNSQGVVDWLKQSNQIGYSFARGVKLGLDNNGDIYVGGIFFGHVNFDADTVQSVGPWAAADDIFIAKYSPQGNLKWIRTAGGIQSDDLTAIAVDSSGNVYVAGTYFSDSIYFGNFLLHNSSLSQELFLAKLDSSGTWQWAKQTHSSGIFQPVVFVTDMCITADDNIILLGTFSSDTVQFDSTHFCTSNSMIYGNVNYIARYDLNGNVQNAFLIDTIYFNNLHPQAIAKDSAGNYYLTGYFLDTVAIGPNIFQNPSNGNSRLFLAKYDLVDNVIWVKQFFTSIPSVYANSRDINIHNGTDIFITGNFNSSLQLDTITLTGGGSDKCFIAQFDTSGHALFAASSPTSQSYGEHISSDSSGIIYLSGFYRGNFSLGQITVSDTGAQGNRYVAKINDLLLGFESVSLQENEIRIFPNPVSNKLLVHFPDVFPEATIEIFSIYGQRILASIISHGRNKIEVEVKNLSSGIYFLKAKTGEKIFIKRIIKT